MLKNAWVAKQFRRAPEEFEAFPLMVFGQCIQVAFLAQDSGCWI
jgi:hypothetical protein